MENLKYFSDELIVAKLIYSIYCLGVFTIAYGGGGHCAMATSSDPKNKKMCKQYCLKLASRMHNNAYF